MVILYTKSRSSHLLNYMLQGKYIVQVTEITDNGETRRQKYFNSKEDAKHFVRDNNYRIA